MTSALETAPHPSSTAANRATQLAERLEQGTRALIALAAELSDDEWRTPLAGDGRPIGVVVHHVASVYPIEIALAQALASGDSIVGVTMSDVHAMNAKHAIEHATVTREKAIELLATNGSAAADAIRALTDGQLALAAPVSLYDGAPVTCQFVLEDHAVRHSYHHSARIREALGK